MGKDNKCESICYGPMDRRFLMILKMSKSILQEEIYRFLHLKKLTFYFLLHLVFEPHFKI